MKGLADLHADLPTDLSVDVRVANSPTFQVTMVV